MSEQEQNSPTGPTRSQRMIGHERSGEGKPRSSTEWKENMGRSFQRATKDHVGGTSNPTEWEAGKRLGKGQGPTRMEIDMMKEDNPSEYRALKAQGMPEDEIFKILGNK